MYFQFGVGEIEIKFDHLNCMYVFTGPLCLMTDARVSSGSLTCNSCALRNLRELAYHYRTDIPNDDLPGAHMHTCYFITQYGIHYNAVCIGIE